MTLLQGQVRMWRRERHRQWARQLAPIKLLDASTPVLPQAGQEQCLFDQDVRLILRDRFRREVIL